MIWSRGLRWGRILLPFDGELPVCVEEKGRERVGEMEWRGEIGVWSGFGCNQ